MAIARTSAIIGGISGTLASQTFRNTRAGLVIASHGRRRNQRTALQVRNAAILAEYQRKWSELLTDQKNYWNTIAKTVTWPNALAIPKHPSGRNLFLCVNCTFWDPTWPPSATTPNDLAEIGEPVANQLGHGTTPPPTTWSASCSLTTGLTVTSVGDVPPGMALFEFLWVSLNLRRGQTSIPQQWIKVGRQVKLTDTLDWTDWADRIGSELQELQTIGIALVWQGYASIPSHRVWQNIQVSA